MGKAQTPKPSDPAASSPLESVAARVTLSDMPTLDIASLTLGEMSDLERDSGRSMDALLKSGRATLLLVALWVADRRSSEKPRSWRELCDLKVFGS
jgi:hypothetical protein